MAKITRSGIEWDHPVMGGESVPSIQLFRRLGAERAAKTLSRIEEVKLHLSTFNHSIPNRLVYVDHPAWPQIGYLCYVCQAMVWKYWPHDSHEVLAPSKCPGRPKRWD